MGVGYNPRIVTNGLVFCADAGNTKSYPGSGTVYTDIASGLVSSASSVTYAAGAMSFNGSNNYVQGADNPILDIQTPTVEAWIKPTTLNQTGFIFEKGTVNSQYNFFFGGAALYWRHTLSGNTFTELTVSTAALSTSAWNHVVATRNGANRYIFFGGSQVATGSHTGTLQTAKGPACIGQFGGANGYPYNGLIAMVRVYNVALSAADVQQNFNALRGRFGV